MEVKLNYRLPQTADRKSSFQIGIENELRRRLQLAGAFGIVSIDGLDIDNDSAACSISVNSSNSKAIDVTAGTVVFSIGEYVDVYPDSLTAIKVDSAITDGQVVRLEYGEVESGDIEANPYYNFAARPKFVKKTPLQMLVIETVTAYNAQTQDVLARSVVLGVIRYVSGVLTVDNGRDTYTFSRPWATIKDVEHRSFVGSGVSSPTNPHGTTPNDLSIGSYSMWQALAGPPSAVLARPVSVGRVPGTLCFETIPATAFLTDSTGRITGKANAKYAPLGFWPERLTRACLSSSPSTEVASWIPRGRNVIAVYDPVNFSVPVNIEINYTKVEAGALPGSLIGLTSFAVGQPNSNELLVAGGSMLTSLSDATVHFTDVGLIPMAFDILVGNDGKVYKRPDCIYCNTKLDTLGSSANAFTIQPRSPTRLRVAISNYVAGVTEVRFQISGLNESGANVTEQVVFTGPLPAPSSGFSESTAQRKFTANTFSAVNQFQVLVRNGDGPNTTVSVFAEYVPERPDSADDLLLSTVFWNGSEISATYANGANVVLDRRAISRGGANRGQTPIGNFLTTGLMTEGLPPQEPFTGAGWVTLVEDFADPQWVFYPRTVDDPPSTLPSNSLGARLLYESRLMPFATEVISPSKLFLRLLPKSIHDWPNSAKDLTFFITLFSIDGSSVVYQTNMASIGMGQPYPPYQPSLTVVSGTLGGKTYYAAKVSAQPNTGGLPPQELFQGFVLQVRD